MKYLQFYLLILLNTRLFALDLITINGKVKSESGEELIGANVSILESSTGTATDVNGNYRFEVSKEPLKNQFFVKASYIGYKSIIDTVILGELKNNIVEVDFILPSDVMRLESVVVTGVGIKQETKKLGCLLNLLGKNRLRILPR